MGYRPVCQPMSITALSEWPPTYAESGDGSVPWDSSAQPSGKAGGVRNGDVIAPAPARAR
jgi:hypothetical protein